MIQYEKLYGLEHWEKLETRIEDVIERVLEDYGDPLDHELERINWPIVIQVYKRMDVKHHADRIAELVLEVALERLDEEYSDPDQDGTEPTQAMKDAAKAFADAVVKDYVTWACEPTSEKITVTLAMAREMFVTTEETQQ